MAGKKNNKFSGYLKADFLIVAASSLLFTNIAYAANPADEIPVGYIGSKPHQVSDDKQRSDEEWARLRDNRIEWDEIQDLVHEYNPTVANLWVNFKDTIGKGKYNVDYEKALQKIEEAYSDSIDAADGNVALEAVATLQYETSYGRTTVDSTAQETDLQAAEYQIKQSEATVADSVRRSIITMYKNEVQRELDELKKNQDEKLYELEQRRKDNGRSTELNVLMAEETVESDKLKLSSSAKDSEHSKQLIRVNLGWTYDSNPEICEVPMVTDKMIEALNVDTDSAIAISQNYTILINERKLIVSETESQISSLTDTISNNKESVKSDMLSRYQSLKQAKNTVEQYKLSAENSRQTLEKVRRNHNVGNSSDRDLETAEYNAAKADLEVKLAEYDLATAYYNYMAGRDGLASAGS